MNYTKKPSVFGAIASAAVAFALLLAAPAAAAGTDGSGPQQAIPLAGTVTGSLAPGQVAWYSYWHDANFNDAVTLKSNPGIAMTPTTAGDYNSGVYFNVEWLGAGTDPGFPGGAFAKDLPGAYRVAQSTQATLKDGTSLPDGTQYWQLGKSTSSLPISLEVVNQSGTRISYALTLARSNDAVSADDNAQPAPAALPIAAASVSQAVSAAPVAAAASTTAGGASPDHAIPLAGTVTGSLAPGQVAWYTYDHDANLNDALTLKSTPAVAMTPTASGDYNGGAFFNVEWAGASTDASFPGGAFAKDLPGFYRVAQSSQSSLDDGGTLPDGTQYWQQGKSPNSTTFQIGVVNETGAPIRYALTLTRSNDAVSAQDDAQPAPTP